MQTIWGVWSGEYENRYPQGFFRNLEEALAYALATTGEKDDEEDYDIQEHAI